MNERPAIAVPTAIEEAQLQFEDWRRGRKRGERIPENLWATAVELAREHGVWPTARALHLSVGRISGHNGELQFNVVYGPLCFLARCSGTTPVSAMEKLSTIQMIDVCIPTVDGRWLILP